MLCKCSYSTVISEYSLSFMLSFWRCFGTYCIFDLNLEKRLEGGRFLDIGNLNFVAVAF
jgi:hypothetical protein